MPGTARDREGIDRRHWAMVLIMLGIHVAVVWAARAPGILLVHNDAMYVLLGGSLRELSYHEVWYVGEPPHAMYPPMYPAVLGVLGLLNGDSFDWLVQANVVASALALALLSAVVRQYWGSGVALACLAALVLNPSIVDAGGSLGAETQMILAMAITLWALSRENRGAHMSVLAAGGAIAAALVRSAAVPLVAAVALYWVWQRRYRAAVVFSAASLFVVGAWLAWTTLVPDQAPGRSYVADALVRAENLSWLQNLANRITNHISGHAEIAYWSLPMPTVGGTKLDNLAGVPIAVGALAFGMWGLLRRWTPAAIYLLLYGALLAVWPYIEARFLVPIVPLLVIGVIVGAVVATARLSPRVGVAIAGTIALLLISTSAVSVSKVLAERFGCRNTGDLPASSCLSPDQRGFFEAVRFIRAHTPQESVFLSAKPATLYYYTGRRSVIRELAARQQADTFLPWLRQSGARYLLLSGFDYMQREKFAPLIHANCDALELAATLPGGVYVFSVPDAARSSGPSHAACRAMGDYYRTHAAQFENGRAGIVSFRTHGDTTMSWASPLGHL